jgi:hypothetical protein
MRTKVRWSVMARALGLVLALGAAAQAGPLPDFTGYTRVGFTPAPVKGKGGAPLKEVRAFGATVYYMVFDQKAEGHKSAAGDTWGVGVKDFDSLFVSGRGNDRGRLDTRARYLYLYQIVNDSGREASAKDVSVRLLVPIDEITSWGHFAERKKTEKGMQGVRGVGFTAPVAGKGKGDVFPVSTAHPGTNDASRVYRSPAPAVTAKRAFGLATIALGDTRPVVDGDVDVGTEPDVVTIVANAERSNRGTDPSVVRIPFINDADRDAALDDPRDRDRIRGTSRDRASYIRAYWADNGVRPGQRSTIFGFTSDIPPVIEEVIVTGRPLAVGAAGGEGEIPGVGDVAPAAGVLDALRTGIVPVAGAVPTPYIAPVSGPRGPTGGPSGDVGSLAGVGLGGLPAGFGGVGGGFGGFNAQQPYARPGVIGGGGGFGGGFGGGEGGGEANTGQDTGTNTGQNQNQGTTTGMTVNNNITVNVNQSQTQNQSQKQSQWQSQKQSQNQGQNQGGGGKGGKHPDGNVIPIPAAWLLGLLGLPAFLFLGRKKPEEAAADEAPPTV